MTKRKVCWNLCVLNAFRGFVMLLIIAAACCRTFAGEAGPPILEHWSTNRHFVLRVTEKPPTLTLLRTYGTAQAKKIGAATVIWRVPSPLKSSDSIPAVAYVRDDGKYIVLLHYDSRIGVGAVLTFLDPSGKQLRRYAPNELFSLSELLENPITTAVTGWDASSFFSFTETGDQFGFLTDHGVTGVFELNTGNRLGDSDPGSASFRDLARQVERRDLNSTTDSTLDQGVMLARALRDRDSVPRLTRLLTDPYHIQAFTTGRHGRQYDCFTHQVDAGYALVEILGPKAAPLIESRLKNANAYMAVEWLGLLGPTGVAGQSPVVLKETQSADHDVRSAAISAITKKGGADVVRQHPWWLEDPSADIRMNSVSSLADGGQARDLPSLDRALDDHDSTVRLLALRGLVRLNAPNLDSLLKRTIRSHPGDVDARVTLVNRGDHEQSAWCVTALSRFADAWRRDRSTDCANVDGIRLETGALPQIAKALVRIRPEGTRAVLMKIASLPGNAYDGQSYFQCVGYGGLAALGDSAALVRVRKLTSDPDPFTAVNAIEWLAITNDRASAPLLRAALTDGEILVRDAARKALAAMGIPENAEPTPVRTPEQLAKRPAKRQRLSFLWFLPIALIGLGLAGFKVARASRK